MLPWCSVIATGIGKPDRELRHRIDRVFAGVLRKGFAGQLDGGTRQRVRRVSTAPGGLGHAVLHEFERVNSSAAAYEADAGIDGARGVPVVADGYQREGRLTWSTACAPTTTACARGGCPLSWPSSCWLSA